MKVATPLKSYAAVEKLATTEREMRAQMMLSADPEFSICCAADQRACVICQLCSGKDLQQRAAIGGTISNLVLQMSALDLHPKS